MQRDYRENEFYLVFLFCMSVGGGFPLRNSKVKFVVDRFTSPETQHRDIARQIRWLAR